MGKEAKIAQVSGFDYLQNMPECMGVSLMKNVGDKIGPDGTAAQKVVGMHMALGSREDLPVVLEKVYEHFHMYDEQGNELILKITDLS